MGSIDIKNENLHVDAKGSHNAIKSTFFYLQGKGTSKVIIKVKKIETMDQSVNN